MEDEIAVPAFDCSFGVLSCRPVDDLFFTLETNLASASEEDVRLTGCHILHLNGSRFESFPPRRALRNIPPGTRAYLKWTQAAHCYSMEIVCVYRRIPDSYKCYGTRFRLYPPCSPSDLANERPRHGGLRSPACLCPASERHLPPLTGVGGTEEFLPHEGETDWAMTRHLSLFEFKGGGLDRFGQWRF